MKANTSRKNSPATFPEKNPRRVIQLDESQMAIYKRGTIEILNPDGEQID